MLLTLARAFWSTVLLYGGLICYVLSVLVWFVLNRCLSLLFSQLTQALRKKSVKFHIYLLTKLPTAISGWGGVRACTVPTAVRSCKKPIYSNHQNSWQSSEVSRQIVQRYAKMVRQSDKSFQTRQIFPGLEFMIVLDIA